MAILSALVHKSLSIGVGGGNNRHCSGVLSRQVAANSVRFRLLSMGISILQTNHSGTALTRSILREKLYSSTLSYFSGEPRYPPKGQDVRDDIVAMSHFWSVMRSEKKHLVQQQDSLLRELATICGGNSMGGSIKQAGSIGTRDGVTYNG